jgi:hypothetical protein
MEYTSILNRTEKKLLLEAVQKSIKKRYFYKKKPT